MVGDTNKISKSFSFYLKTKLKAYQSKFSRDFQVQSRIHKLSKKIKSNVWKNNFQNEVNEIPKMISTNLEYFESKIERKVSSITQKKETQIISCKSKPILSDITCTPLQTLKSMMIHLFLNLSLKKTEFIYSENESNIFQAILKKKKIPFDKNRSFDSDYISQLNKFFSKKKRETYLKYVIPNCIKHLKKKYFENTDNFFYKYSKSIKINTKNKDRLFYQYYFGEFARKKVYLLSVFIYLRTLLTDILKTFQKP